MSRSSSEYPVSTWRPLRALLLLGAIAASAPATSAAQEPTADEYADQGYKKYEKGEFAEAIALYMRGFKISQDARILFNVAQIYDRKIQDRELAIEYYRRYLKSTTTEADLIKKATDRIRQLQEQTAPAAPTASGAPAQASAAPPVNQAPPAPVERSSAPVWIGWTATGLLAAGAVVTGLVASSRASDARKISFSAGASGPADDRMSSAKTMALVSTLLTGGAVLAGGVTIYLSVTPRSTTALTVGPGSLHLGGAF
jgi:tetratricopeptide (TPR) repeat protein